MPPTQVPESSTPEWSRRRTRGKGKTREREDAGKGRLGVRCAIRRFRRFEQFAPAPTRSAESHSSAHTGFDPSKDEDPKTDTRHTTHDTRHKKKHRHRHSHRHRLRSEIDRDTRDRPRIADIESPIHRVTETHTHSQSQHHIASAQMTPPVSSLRPPPRDAPRDAHPVMHTLIHVANVRVKAQAPSGKS